MYAHLLRFACIIEFWHRLVRIPVCLAFLVQQQAA